MTNKKTILKISAIIFATKIIGFLRNIVLSYYYGTTDICDIYNISQIIPVTLFGSIGASLGVSYIPLYNSIRTNLGDERADRFTSNLVVIVTALATIVIVITIIFSDQIVRLFAPGFDNLSLIKTVAFLRIMVYSLYFTGIIFIFSSYMKVKDKFLIPSMVGLPYSLIQIISIYISTKTTEIVLAYGVLVATFSQFTYISYFVSKANYKFNFFFSLNSEYIKKTLTLSIPVIISRLFDQVNVVVDKSIASKITTGGISSLSYGYIIINLLYEVFPRAINSVAFVKFSKLRSENNDIELNKYISKVINNTLVIVIPATCGIIFFAKPIIRFIYMRGAFDEASVCITSGALIFYAIGLPANSVRAIMLSVFHSNQNTKLPMISGVYGVVGNIFLNIILSKFMGINGLALATSLSIYIVSITLLVKHKSNCIDWRKILKYLLKITIFSLIISFLALAIYERLCGFLIDEVSLIVSILLGVLLYISILWIFNMIPEKGR